MFYSDWLYWLFIAFVCSSYYLLPGKIRPLLIVAAGANFYGYYAGPLLMLLITEACLIGWAAAFISRRTKRWFFAGVIAGAALVLIYYKYNELLLQPVLNLFSFFNKPYLPRADQVVLPLGISYFTFELIHYLVEKKKENLPEHRFTDFLAFVFFFPTLFAGPIKQFEKYFPQLRSRFEWANMRSGLVLIATGLFKKLVLAGTLDILAQPLYAKEGMAAEQTLMLWAALVAYTFVIYFDFSGYSDIAIGTARLFGIVLPPNFRNPYLSRNIAEFWNRWHVSLGAWLTKYIYFPLGGSRLAEHRTYINLMLTMTVSGLWHGAAWHFVVWGMFHGAMLCIYRFYVKRLKGRSSIPFLSPAFTALAVVFTFFCVTISRIFFVMPISEGWKFSLKLLGLENSI
ncbi:acyltransferase [Cohnella kolymensis]|uniref:Acyltransferase n=1 Tax=Cohnella kolymensis TaxID=1590652 RepID=A0ABR5A3Z8_9BACL|nr:MBOAT family O-acyltransferase [Cohnella kolymensis]KIL35775.1 acyltransferase [Cohnella kolymensis]